MVVLEYDGTEYKFHDGMAGIAHRVMQLVDRDGSTQDVIRIIAWVKEEVSHCTLCGKDNVLFGPCRGNQPLTHQIVNRLKTRDIIIMVDYDEAFHLALSLMRDVSLGKYGSG